MVLDGQLLTVVTVEPYRSTTHTFCTFVFFQNEKSQKERIAPLKSFQSKYVVVVLFDLEALGKTLLINFLF